MNTELVDQNQDNSRRSFMIDTSQSSRSGSPFEAVTVNQPLQEPPQVIEDIDDSDDFTDDDNIEIGDDTSSDNIPFRGDSSDDTTSDDTDSEVNPYFYLQQQLKSEGFISDDIEFDQRVDGMSVYNAYKEKLKTDIEPVVKQEVLAQMAQVGYNESDLMIARAIRQGVDPRLLSTVSAYEVYATMPDTVDDDQKVAVVRSMYQARGLNKNEIDNLIKVAEDTVTLDNVFAESKNFFGNKYHEFIKQEEERFSVEQQIAQQEVLKTKQLITNVITSQEVMGEKMTRNQAKALEDAIYKESEVVEIQGNRYRATEMQKFLLEFENNPEMKLYMFKAWKFRDQEKDQIKAQTKKEVETEFLQGYKTRVVQSQKATKNKALKDKLETNRQHSNSFFIDVSKR